MLLLILLCLMLRQLLANLYARGAALQCCFNQESLDFLIPVYTGSIIEDAIFDPAALSAVVVQVKFKSAGDKQAGNLLRPVGIPRDLSRPLPYLALLMELGNESTYRETGSKILTMIPSHEADKDFRTLVDHWFDAKKELETYRNEKKVGQKKGKKEIEKEAKIEMARLAMDSYNRYAIFVRGTSSDTYGILKAVDIENEFATFLSVTLPSPPSQITAIQQMLPLERLGSSSDHTPWMSTYIVGDVGNDETDNMEVMEVMD
jgi:hypothetical protein